MKDKKQPQDCELSLAGECKLFKHYALSHANQWFMLDRQFMQNLNPSHAVAGDIDARFLGRLAVKYKVARNF